MAEETKGGGAAAGGKVNSAKFNMVGGLAVRAFNDDQFRRMREADGLGSDMVAAPESFDFKTLAAGGGKGGELRGRRDEGAQTNVAHGVYSEAVKGAGKRSHPFPIKDIGWPAKPARTAEAEADDTRRTHAVLIVNSCAIR